MMKAAYYVQIVATVCGMRLFGVIAVTKWTSLGKTCQACQWQTKLTRVQALTMYEQSAKDLGRLSSAGPKQVRSNWSVACVAA